MRFSEQRQQWEHTVEEEQAFGAAATARSDLPPSFQAREAEYENDGDSTAGKLAALRSRLRDAEDLLCRWIAGTASLAETDAFLAGSTQGTPADSNGGGR